MPITTTNPLRDQILATAWEWKLRSCRETVANGGSCIDEIQAPFGGSREPYCARFVWVVINDACRVLGIENLLPKTSGALDMLRRSIAGNRLRVDGEPALGSVFYRRTTAPGASGHMGIVYGVDDPRMLWSIEGNHGDRIDLFGTTWDYVRDPRNGFQFIHTELMAPPGLVEAHVATITAAANRGEASAAISPWIIAIGGATLAYSLYALLK